MHLLSTCPRFFPLFPGISATVSIHLITPTAVLKPGSASSPGVLHQIPVLSHSSFLFLLTKKATSVFRVLANHSASFSFLHPVRRFLRTTILTSVYPLLYLSGHRIQTSVGFHSDLDLLLRPRGIDLQSLFFF